MIFLSKNVYELDNSDKIGKTALASTGEELNEYTETKTLTEKMEDLNRNGIKSCCNPF